MGCTLEGKMTKIWQLTFLVASLCALSMASETQPRFDRGAEAGVERSVDCRKTPQEPPCQKLMSRSLYSDEPPMMDEMNIRGFRMGPAGQQASLFPWMPMPY